MNTPPSKVSDGELPERIWIRWLGIITSARGPQGHAYVVDPKYPQDTTEFVPASKLREAEEKIRVLRTALEEINEPRKGISLDYPEWCSYSITNLYKIRDIARNAMARVSGEENKCPSS